MREVSGLKDGCIIGLSPRPPTTCALIIFMIMKMITFMVIFIIMIIFMTTNQWHSFLHDPSMLHNWVVLGDGKFRSRMIFFMKIIWNIQIILPWKIPTGFCFHEKQSLVSSENRRSLSSQKMFGCKFSFAAKATKSRTEKRHCNQIFIFQHIFEELIHIINIFRKLGLNMCYVIMKTPIMY